MKIQIKYKEFYKIIECPANTFTIGVKINQDKVVNNALHHIFENITCSTHIEILPNGTKIKFYFYTCEDTNILHILKDSKDITHFLFTQDHLQIKSINE